MREFLSIALCLATTTVLILLSCITALRGNRPHLSNKAHSQVNVPAQTSVSSIQPDPGQTVFEQQKCLACHSFRGRGNPRYPLDGASARLTPGQMRAWITGTGPAASLLPGAIKRKKESYLKLTEQETADLIQYLASPRNSTNQFTR